MLEFCNFALPGKRAGSVIFSGLQCFPHFIVITQETDFDTILQIEE